MSDTKLTVGERYQRGIVTPHPTSGPFFWLDVNRQWRGLIGFVGAPPVVTAEGNLRPSDVVQHRAFRQGILEWMLRDKTKVWEA